MGAPDSQMVDAFRLVDRIWAEHYAPRVPLDVDEWADRHRHLPPGSAYQGIWRTERTPYARGIYKALSDSDPCEDVVLMCATQLVKSEAGLNWVGCIIDQTPAPVMIVQATVNTGKRYSRQRVGPMIQYSPALRSKVASAVSRDAANSMSMKEFTGGVLIITGANSGAELASMPIKYIHFDEVDDYPLNVDGQGDPIAVGTARQDSYRRRKRLKSSSPKRPKGLSTIETAYESGTQEKYHVPCPHCGHKQELLWSHLKWDKDEHNQPIPESAKYACDACGTLVDERHKTAMLEGGEWIARFPERKIRSFHLNSLYSPSGWLSWASLVLEWAEAQKDLASGKDEKYKAFVNTRLAQTVAEQAEQIAANELVKTAEDWAPDVVPLGGLIITVGVDVQDDRIECFPWAFGENDQMWMLKREVIMGNPGETETWAKLDAYLTTRYKHASGATLGIEAVGIDSGGHYTHSVYNFVRRAHPARKIAALKGDNHKPGIPILGRATLVDVNWQGGIIKGGCKLWTVGVNTAKDLLHARLKRPGMVHLSKHMDAEIYDQLVAEKRVPQRTARGTRYMWVKPSSNTRNEALDGTVYAMWCAERIGISRYPQKVWEQLRERIQPRIGNLFDQPAKEPPAPKPVQTSAPKPKQQPASRFNRPSLLGKLRGR